MTATTVEPTEPTIPVVRPIFEVVGKYTGKNVLGTFDELQDAVDFMKRYDLFASHEIRKVVW